LNISILLLLVIAIVTGFELLVMSLGINSALGQWILPSQLKDAYKQGYLANANVTVIDAGGIKQK
jgi:hypothetical protein